MISKYEKKNIIDSYYFFLIVFFLILFIQQYIFQKFYPNSNNLLGHDYEHYIPSLIFGKIWFYNNFFSIPWFTPYICCGIPFYADPNSMYYSIIQIIFLIFNPIFAIKTTFFFLSLMSYIGMFLLTKRSFKFKNFSALLCATLFLFNGFFIFKSIAGHVSYLSYIFVPLYCYFLIASCEYVTSRKGVIYILLSSLVFAHFFHAGSGGIIFIIFSSIISVLLIYAHLNSSLKIFYKFFQSLFLGLLISLSKISASLFFLKNFPRRYTPIEFESLFSYLKTFFLSFFIKPDVQYFNDNVISMFPLGLHEIEFSLSIVPIILLFFIFFLKTNIFKIKYINVRFVLLIFTIFSIPLLFNVNLIGQYELIKKIPVLSSSWVQVRWMAVYILPIIIICGLIVENIKTGEILRKYFSIGLISIILIQNISKDNNWHFNDQKYHIKNAVDFSLKIKREKIPEIIGPAVLYDKLGKPKKINYKNDLFFFGYSPILCYQPIFGYGLEKLNMRKIMLNSKSTLDKDSFLIYSNKFDKKDGNFMFFNPSCFLFPKANNCLPGDTFKISEKEKLTKFTNYKKFEFKQNKFQIAANYISIFSFLGCLLYLIYHFIIFIYGLRKKY